MVIILDLPVRTSLKKSLRTWISFIDSTVVLFMDISGKISRWSYGSLHSLPSLWPFKEWMSHPYFDVPSWETDFSVHQTWIVEPFKNLRIHFCSFTRHLVKAFSWSMLKHLRIQLSTTAKIHKNLSSLNGQVSQVTMQCISFWKSSDVSKPSSISSSDNEPLPSISMLAHNVAKPTMLPHEPRRWRIWPFFRPPFKRKITQEVDQQTWRINNVQVNFKKCCSVFFYQHEETIASWSG